MKNVLIDAGPIIALFDRDDQHHERVLDAIRDFQGTLVSTWPVITEVSYMLDFHKQVQLDFLSWILDGGIQIAQQDVLQMDRIKQIMDDFADLPADLADASLLVAAEQASLNIILTLDRDFEVYRLSGGGSLINMLAG